MTLQNRGGVRTADTEDIRNRHDARRTQSVVRVISVRAGIDDDESATAGILLSNERQARSRLIVPLDDHVLEQVAETGFDRALVSAVDLEIVGNRALLTDMPVGLHEHHPGGITEVRTAGSQLFERREPSLDGGQLLLARARISRARLRARFATSRAAMRRAASIHA